MPRILFSLKEEIAQGYLLSLVTLKRISSKHKIYVKGFFSTLTILSKSFSIVVTDKQKRIDISVKVFVVLNSS